MHLQEDSFIAEIKQAQELLNSSFQNGFKGHVVDRNVSESAFEDLQNLLGQVINQLVNKNIENNLLKQAFEANGSDLQQVLRHYIEEIMQLRMENKSHNEVAALNTTNAQELNTEQTFNKTYCQPTSEQFVSEEKNQPHRTFSFSERQLSPQKEPCM